MSVKIEDVLKVLAIIPNVLEAVSGLVEKAKEDLPQKDQESLEMHQARILASAEALASGRHDDYARIKAKLDAAASSD